LRSDRLDLQEDESLRGAAMVTVQHVDGTQCSASVSIQLTASPDAG